MFIKATQGESKKDSQKAAQCNKEYFYVFDKRTGIVSFKVNNKLMVRICSMSPHMLSLGPYAATYQHPTKLSTFGD